MHKTTEQKLNRLGEIIVQGNASPYQHKRYFKLFAQFGRECVKEEIDKEIISKIKKIILMKMEIS